MRNPIIISLLILASCSIPKEEKQKDTWHSLFNGKDLNNWTVKFNHHRINENYRNTFRVEDSILKVDYSGYDSIQDEFGHLFYNQSFSNYKLRVEYRFTGNQVKGGPGWAYRNNGIMYHCQDPQTMLTDQPFPVCLEAQLLGADEGSVRTTGNLCTPGTHIEMNGSLITQHCINSSSKTYPGDQWVQFELVVYKDSIIHHIVEGDTVLSFTRPQTGGELPDGFPLPEGFALTKGYIAIQAESHPTEFRKIDIMELQ